MRVLWLCLALVCPLAVPEAEAAAPLRDSSWCTANGMSCPSGRPYAEATLCSRSDVIFCEDWDYSEHFTCAPRAGQDSNNQTWRNPGASEGYMTFVYCTAASYPAASGFMSDSRVTGGVFKADPTIDPGGASLEMCILGDCDRATADTPATYQNGNAASNDLYMRFMMFTSTNWHWPDQCCGRDNKVMFFYPNQFTGKTNANFDAGFSFNTDIHCPSPLNANFSDAVNMRVGHHQNNSFPKYPADANIPFNNHYEYCTGQGAPNNDSPSDGTVAVVKEGAYGSPPSCDANAGTLFRMCENRWYSVEWRYKMPSTPNTADGTIEMWIDGKRIYGDSDLPTCAGFSGEGSCYAIHQIQLLNSWYYCSSQGCPDTDWQAAKTCNGCYRLIDNFVIATSYIGPPESMGASSAPLRLEGTVRMLGGVRFQ